MSLQRLKRKYTIAAMWYDATRWIYIRGRRRVVAELKLQPGQRVIEIGCGTGTNLPYLADAVGPTGTVVGLDYVRAMLDRARPKADRLNAAKRARVFLLQADAAHLPLQGPFDAVLFSYSLTMIPDWQRALDEAVALLRPEGTLASLDFSDARGWPWGIRHILTNWLRGHGVYTGRDFPAEFTRRTHDPNLREISIGNHYVRLVLATKKAAADTAATAETAAPNGE